MINRIFPKKSRLYLLITLGLWVVYAILTVMAPHHSNTYNLPSLTLLLLELSVILPLLVIWLMAVNGAASFERYARAIKGSEDGRGLDLISTGVLLVVLYYILESVLRSLPVYYTGTPGDTALVGISNYVPMIVALAGFILIFAGSLQLRNLSLRRLSPGGLASILLPYLLLAVIYGRYAYNRLPLVTMTGAIPQFSLPGKWPFFTLLVPYTVAWLLGVLAITIIAEYARTVSGTIYRRALKDLVRGLVAVMAFSIVLQLLQLSTKIFAGLSLGLVLVLLYAIIVTYAVGFVFIARGARKLMMIEESL